jgi:hypothetical protein
MIRKVLLAAVLLAALPLVAGSASGAGCTPWNAHSNAQHHKVGKNLDIVGGHGYGSGFHTAPYYSPPQPLGAYGDPKRKAAQGGYIQYKKGKTVATVYLFGPFDENDTSHTYDTVYGACVSQGSTKVDTKPLCTKTSAAKKPKGHKACGGY